MMWTPAPHWFVLDTVQTLQGFWLASDFPNGHPWIDSPIFDRLAAERFGA